MSELNIIAKSLANCGKLAIVLATFKGLLSDQLIKLIDDIVCNTADLAFKNIIVPTELFIQSVNSLTNLF